MIMEEKRMKITAQTGLVLEGGGMRGVFTCGVLDYLMDAGIKFPYTIGVSAGACNGLSYMSHQKGRGKYSNIDLLAKYKYIGIRPLLKKRGLIDKKLLFHHFPDFFDVFITQFFNVTVFTTVFHKVIIVIG